jgi:hypothetical protein
MHLLSTSTTDFNYVKTENLILNFDRLVTNLINSEFQYFSQFQILA